MNPLAKMSHLSWECVFKYMDYNARIIIALQLPAFHQIEKLYPYHINKIEIKSNTIKINNTCYQLGVVCHYHEGETPADIIKQNGNGGLQYDVDSYGFKNEEERRSVMSEWKDIQDYLNNNERPPVRRRFFVYTEEEIERIRSKVEILQAKVQNLPPPFTYYLRLTVSSDSLRVKENMWYHNNISFAMNYLVNKLFSQNKAKLKVAHLKIDNRVRMRLVQAMINYRKYPLESVEITVYGGFPNSESFLSHPLLASAQRVTICGNYLSCTQYLKTPRVHIQPNSISFSSFMDFLMALSQSAVGKNVTMNVLSRMCAQDIIREIQGNLQYSKKELKTKNNDFPFYYLLETSANTDFIVYFTCDLELGSDENCTLHAEVHAKGRFLL